MEYLRWGRSGANFQRPVRTSMTRGIRSSDSKDELVTVAASSEHDWQRTISHLTDAFDAQFSVTVLSEASGCSLRPIIQNVGIGKYRLVVPVGEEGGRPAVAVGTLDAEPRSLLEKLLELSVRYIRESRHFEEQRLDLEAYAHQVHQDFEELHWLRSQLGHLKDCDADLSAEDLGKTILGSLCTIVGVEGMALVAADRRNASPGQKVPPAGKTVFRHGPGHDVVDDESCCQLVDRLREVAAAGPLVQNEMKRRREFSMVPEIHSCILVPVVRGETFLGWLLAFNRAPAAGESDTAADEALRHSSQHEFGTIEASLLESAAAILAIHPQSEKLFAG